MLHARYTLRIMPLAVFFLLVFVSGIGATPTTAAYEVNANTTTAATALALKATVAATAAAVPAAVDGNIIGATSLAAVAAASAAVAMAATDNMARSSSVGGNNHNNHNNQSNNRNNHHTTNNNNNDNNDNLNNGLIADSANLLLENFQQHATGHIVNLTRQHDGDVFRTNGVTSCTADTCVGLSSGTAGLLLLDGARADGLNRAANVGSFAQLELLSKRTNAAKGGAGTGAGGTGAAVRDSAGSVGGGETCQCRCLPYLGTYREDLGICVDDIHECTLSPFVSGSSSEKIPFVFLPLRGQIIYPSREISFPDIHTPVCAVTGAQYLTANGWSDLRNPIDTDYPFRMFRDEGRTFLQWLGEPDLRHKMQGRLIVVHLVCRDMTLALNATTKAEHIMPPKNVFSPCVAFRVNGSPVKYIHNVSEVLFQSETTTTLASTSDGMTTKEYVVIGVCSLLLGLIYVSSVFLYLHMKKRKTRDQSHMRNSIDDLANEINYPKNDQVTFGAPFNRSGSIYSATSMTTSNEPRSRASIGSLKEEMGIVKSNPLLQHFPQLGDHSGFASDVSNSNSECEMEGGFHHDKLKQMQTAALVHPQLGMCGTMCGTMGAQHGDNGNASGEESIEREASPTQENECLPIENVSIVEEMMTEEKLENLRAMINGNVRKKLYFNPAYFEPHLLAQPPPAAVEFLQKIREVIAIAKYKMATKRYQPSLIMIPEEGAGRSSTPSLYSSQMQTSADCQACASSHCSGHVKNCGEKRNSIEKWLQSVATTEESQPASHKFASATASNATSQSQSENKMSTPNKTSVYNMLQKSSGKTFNSISSNQERRSSPPACETNRNSPRKEITQPKQRPPPPPTPNANQKGSSPSPCKDVPRSAKPSIVEVTHHQSPHVDNSAPDKSSPPPCPHYYTSIPINRNYDSFSALSAAANIYGFAETGSEIYNNPKFTLHDSPAASQRSRSSSRRSKSSRKRLDVLDQYAAASTPTSLTSADRQHYEMLRNMKKMPDMVYDAIARDYNSSLSSNEHFHLDIPTPDYDSTMEKKIKDIYNNTQSSAPSVPTPDYSTLSRKSLKQCQPDSPIYRRKSPQYLIVDYETDSLERLERSEATKRKSSHSSSSPSSDVSSQLSPSLSTALPLEEELEISHAVYDKVQGFRKEGDVKKKITSKANSGFSKVKQLAARIKYDTPFRGSMTIEVEHEPPSDIERSTDSEQYDPDTLDRNTKKQSFCDVNAWSGQLQKTENLSKDAAQYVQLKKIGSSGDVSQEPTSMPATQGNVRQTPFVLKSSNSFRTQTTKNSTYESHVEMRLQSAVEAGDEVRPNVSSLRDLYQSPLERQKSQQGCKCGVQANRLLAENLEALTEQGRLLTLEAKHTRRQRVIESSTTQPVVEITQLAANKTSIKISTPKVNRAVPQTKGPTMPAIVAPQVHNLVRSTPGNLSTTANSNSNRRSLTSGLYDLTKNFKVYDNNSTQSTPNNVQNAAELQKKRAARTPPPPPPSTASATTTLQSQKSHTSSQHSQPPHYQNQNQYMQHSTTPTEDETMSNHSESTEITGVSDTVANSEFDGSCNNTLSSVAPKANNEKQDFGKSLDLYESRCNKVNSQPQPAKNVSSPQVAKKLKDDRDYGALFNTHINGLRNDYSLTKYLNRRKSQDRKEEPGSGKADDTDAIPQEANNNIKNTDSDASKFDVLSISSRSNRSSNRLSDRTKEMYRNAGVPVGIAYPQRSSTGSTNQTPPSSTNVQSVYRCEIEPVQLTHGMQIAMGLKDRAKKAKDLKNAWKKFVSMAAAKFSPTHSPAPPFEKKLPSFLEVLDRDEGISSLIDEQPQVSTPKSSYSAPASQNYYEQRFGVREMDSGYMSADSGEVYKRNFYDRYNFKMMSGRDRIIRVDTIEDNSDGSSTLTNRHNSSAASTRRGSILDSNRFEDFEHLGEPGPGTELANEDDNSDADSNKTLTQTDDRQGGRGPEALTVYSSEDEQGQSTSYGSSETDGETNAEDMWESGAESIETHSVLYKNVRKN